MQDILDVIKNVENIYDSDTSFTVLKDFERVLDELDLYVYKNWEDGELVSGPNIKRHWIICSFMLYIKVSSSRHTKFICAFNPTRSSFSISSICKWS